MEERTAEKELVLRKEEEKRKTERERDGTKTRGCKP